MLNRLFLLNAVFFALLVTGCGRGGSDYRPEPKKPAELPTFKPGDELAMFPLAVGNQWVYTAESVRTVAGQGSGTGKTEITFKVLEVNPIAGGRQARIEVTAPKAQTPTSAAGLSRDVQIWDVTNKGIYQRSVGETPVQFEPIQPNILFPPDPDRRFAWKGTGATPGGGRGTQNMSSRILPMQFVDTETERYPAIPVEARGTFDSGKAKGQVASITYWSPNVGLVRYRQEVASGNTVIVLTLKLKAKTVR
jgi:hypothetical protein